jgi:hypothetical protein
MSVHGRRHSPKHLKEIGELFGNFHAGGLGEFGSFLRQLGLESFPIGVLAEN